MKWSERRRWDEMIDVREEDEVKWEVKEEDEMKWEKKIRMMNKLMMNKLIKNKIINKNKYNLYYLHDTYDILFIYYFLI